MGLSALLPFILLPAAPDSSRVLLVINGWSTPAQSIGKYYALKRGLPKANVLYVETPPEEEIAYARYQKDIEQPVRKALAKLKNVDFIVVTKDMPLRFTDRKFHGGYSVDAFLGMHEKPIKPLDSFEPSAIARIRSPYFGKKEAFRHSKYGFYIVTRLDGYSDTDVKRMIDNGIRATPEKGLFLLDEAENRNDREFGETQKHLGVAAKLMKGKGYEVRHDTTDTFLSPTEQLMGYAGWGSNDGAYSLDAYRRLRFKPGSIAETFVSTSGRTFRRTSGGQSLIADLLEQGLTGAKGYVGEPFTFALARPDILFDRYTSGFNLGESFAMASPTLMWKDVIVGDPLCSPYARKK